MDKNHQALIAQLHQQLNHPDIVPRHCYRRNKVHYPLVCYINTLIGLLLSENHASVPIFIDRAIRHMTEFPATEESAAYYQLVDRYLDVVSSLMQARGHTLIGQLPSEYTADE
ncbi:MAG TPA: hypothetical protein VN156_17785 [Pseudomonas sp.]|nr:hypothetical protein [Pseudomonas sp.]